MEIVSFQHSTIQFSEFNAYLKQLNEREQATRLVIRIDLKVFKVAFRKC